MTACRLAFVAFATLLTFSLLHGQPAHAGTVPDRAVGDATGTLAGRVLDARTGEGLPGAAVFIGALGMGAATDPDGRFVVNSVPAGTYDVEVRFLGYTTKTVTGVTVRDGQTTSLDVTLSDAAEELDAVTVTAERERGSTAALLTIRKLAPSVIDVVSRSDIQLAGSDAAAAISRTPAAEAKDGKFIRVRGFGDRYANLTLNGIPIPSITPDRREVPLDLFPASALESARVVKGWTPDLPADFAGGLIQLFTRDTPPGRILRIKASNTFNTATTFQEGIYLGGCSSAWTGLSSCYADYPDAFFDGRDIEGQSATDDPNDPVMPIANPRSPEEQEALGEAIAATMPYNPTVRTAPVNQAYGLTYGDAFDLAGRRLGLITVLTYDNTYSVRTDYRERLLSSADENGDGIPEPLFDTDYRGEYGELAVRVGGIANVGYAVSDASKLAFTAVYNRTTEDLARTLEGYRAGEDQNLYIPQLRRLESQLLTTRLSGDHRLPVVASGATVDWQLAYTRTGRFEPGTRAPVYEQRFPLEDSRALGYRPLPDQPFRYYESNFASLAAVFHQDQDDNGYTAGLNATVPFRVLDRPVQLKLGGLVDYRDREVYTRRIFFTSEGTSNLILPEKEGTLPPDDLHSPGFIEVPAPGESAIGFRPEERGTAADNYEASAENIAAYAMLDVELVGGVRVVGGARLEDARQDGRAFGNFGEQFSQGELERTWGLSNTDILPSIAVTVSPSETMNVRAGLARTVARPQFREFAPITFYDFFGGITSVGNPELERVFITNADLRWEMFFGAASVVSVGAFYKGFGRPIESIWQSGDDRTWINTGRARAYGVEFEVRGEAGRWASTLDGLSVNANLTLMYSEVDDFPSRDSGGRPRLIPADERPVFGQTPFLVNVITTYDIPKTGTSVSALLQATGRQLEIVSNGDLRPAIYEAPRTELDVVVEQPLGRGFALRASARRLLGSEVRFEQDFPSGETVATTAYDRGRNLSLSLSWGL
ncbi:MAG: TonB-dependent receptor [Bacteroidota bacterium]